MSATRKEANALAASVEALHRGPVLARCRDGNPDAYPTCAVCRQSAWWCDCTPFALTATPLKEG